MPTTYGWAGQQLATDTFASGSLAAGWGVAYGSYASQISAGPPYYAEPPDTTHASDNVWTGLVWPNDHVSEVTLQTITAESGTHFGLWVRVQSGSLSGYVVDYASGVSNGVLTLYRCDSGAFTSLATLSATAASGDVWTLEAAGAALTVYQNGAMVTRYADATYQGGSPGFRQSSTVNVAHSQIASWRGYGPIQQDGIWQKQGVVLAPVAGDISSGGGGLANSSMLHEGNAQILSGTVYKMWFSAGAPGAENNVYYAESTDGKSWTRYGSAVLANYASPFIIKNGATYNMYVQPVASPGSGNFALFQSTDGINWGSAVSTNVLGLGTSGQWDDTIIWYFQPLAIIGGTWYAVYSGGHNGTIYQLSMGLATSSDGITWAKYNSNAAPVLTSTNGGSIVNGSAFAKVGSTYYMWVFASQPGQGANSLNPGEGVRYQTTDFIHWTNPVHSVHRTELFEGVNFAHGQCYPNSIFTVGNQTYLYLQDATSDGSAPAFYQISLATASVPIATIVTANEDATVQIASDAFGGGAGDLSANWTTPTGYTKLQKTAGGLCKASATSAVCAGAYTGASFSNDQYSEITISTLTGTQILLPAVRMQLGAETLYDAFLIGPAGTLGTVQFYKSITGVSTTIGPTAAFTPQLGDVLRLAVVGNVLSFYQNGFLVLQYEDFSSALTSGYPGLAIYTDTLTSAQISLWAGGNANVMPYANISGSAGVAGATVSYAGTASGSVVADGSGNYVLPLLNGTYTITPSKTGYTFSPTSASETVNGADITGVSFTASQSQSSSGYSSTSGLQYTNMLNWLRQI